MRPLSELPMHCTVPAFVSKPSKSVSCPYTLTSPCSLPSSHHQTTNLLPPPLHFPFPNPLARPNHCLRLSHHVPRSPSLLQLRQQPLAMLPQLRCLARDPQHPATCPPGPAPGPLHLHPARLHFILPPLPAPFPRPLLRLRPDTLATVSRP